MDFNHLLHECRSANLRTIDAHGKTMVSVGASALWYFEWIDRCCGRPGRHIGVEYYMPRPDGLPAGVEWVENTAGAMVDVADGVGDVLFSGQNIEHLWEAEISGFLLEAHRVLKVGGLCVIDSPNRLVAAHIDMVHPEHICEFTPDEITELMTLAGFDVTSMRGIWLCRDPHSGGWLETEENRIEPPNSAIDRVAAAPYFPNESYIWWLEAKRADRAPDKAGLKARIADIFKEGWQDRLNRLSTVIGEKIIRNGEVFIESAPGKEGFVAYGPYAPVEPGRNRISISVKGDGSARPDAEVGYADLTIGSQDEIVATRTLYGRDIDSRAFAEIAFDYDTPDTKFGMQIRLRTTGAEALTVKKRVTVTRGE